MALHLFQIVAGLVIIVNGSILLSTINRASVEGSLKGAYAITLARVFTVVGVAGSAIGVVFIGAGAIGLVSGGE